MLDAVLGDMGKLFSQTHFKIFHNGGGLHQPFRHPETRASACGLGDTLLTRAVPCTPEFHPACQLSGTALDAVLVDMEKLFFKTHRELFHNGGGLHQP